MGNCSCGNVGVIVLYRNDDVDIEGTLFCAACERGAVASGEFVYGSDDADADADDSDFDDWSDDDGMTDAEADADALRGIGWGTDEDYGYYGDGDW